uniref:Small ribosomal subunit protein uS11c n=1 Tax=Tydemania expeditionis TaxID=325645 RepID=A0A0D6E1M4_TYDEX|nr:30S ribosomal protein S11 [Tydemania expeditionis]CEO91129.1 30S ribosomal protein S11 [Tydemania expeditionis]
MMKTFFIQWRKLSSRLLVERSFVERSFVERSFVERSFVERSFVETNVSLNLLTIHIKATFNNTLLTLTNSNGEVLTWTSAGSCGFKGARKGTAFAAKKVVEVFLKKSIDYLSPCQQIKIYVCGIGPGRQNALRGFANLSDHFSHHPKQKRDLKFPNKIILIREITKIPHNGCRPPKKRRL